MERDNLAQAEARGIAVVLGMLTQALAMIDIDPSLSPSVGARLQEVIDSIHEQHRPGPQGQKDKPIG